MNEVQEYILKRAMQKVAKSYTGNPHDEVDPRIEIPTYQSNTHWKHEDRANILRQVENLRSNRSGRLSENIPQWTQALGYGMLTEGLGAPISLVLNMGGKLVGTLKKPRTAKEQIDYENSSKYLNWFVPGFPSYNKARSNVYYDDMRDKALKAYNSQLTKDGVHYAPFTTLSENYTSRKLEDMAAKGEL